MKSASLFTLLATALTVAAHPATRPLSRRKVVDLNAFRVPLKTSYKDSTTAGDSLVAIESLMELTTTDLIDAATRLVQSEAPGATFRLVADHWVGANGVAHVYFKQTANGLDIDNADFNVNVAADGSIFSFGNSFYQGTVPSAIPLRARDVNEPVAALKGARDLLELPISTSSAIVEAADAPETFAIKQTSGTQRDPQARLVYFQAEDGSLKLTWRVETDILDNWLLTYVDAETKKEIHGVVDYVSDYSASFSYNVFPFGINDPTDGSRQLVTNPWVPESSEFGWQGDGNTTYSTTRGNNGIAQSNPTGNTSVYLTNYRPMTMDGTFDYPYSATVGEPKEYVNAAITQVWYTANSYHDLLYTLGFTEEAGNFETNNNGQGGKGSDAVILNVQDGSGLNNANFATPADGTPGRMRMYLWNKSVPGRDGAFDAGVVIHEYTHGLSNRLTGGPANSGCLSALESGGMGEGWSDFFATAIRLRASDTRETDYPIGAWVANNPVGIRQYLYSTSLETNKHTYTSVNALTAVHPIGNVWATFLYEVMWNLIDKYGITSSLRPTIVDGLPTDGRHLAMKLVLEGMALQPCNPNFVQARDAILDADVAFTNGANQCELWTAFAKRGLGEGARYAASNRTGSNVIPEGVC